MKTNEQATLNLSMPYCGPEVSLILKVRLPWLQQKTEENITMKFFINLGLYYQY